MLFWFNMQNDKHSPRYLAELNAILRAAEVLELKLSEAKLTLCVSDHFPESHETKEGLKNPGRNKLHMKSIKWFNDNH